MITGDKIRLRSTPACRDILGLDAGTVGVVRGIDAVGRTQSLSISFSGIEIFTSALCEGDYEVLCAAEPPNERPPP